MAPSWRWEPLTITPSHVVLPLLSDVRDRQLDKLSPLVIYCHELSTPLHIDAFRDYSVLRTVKLHTNYASAQFELHRKYIVEFFDYRSMGDSESIYHVIDIIQRCPNTQTLHTSMACSPTSAAGVNLTPPFIRSSLRDLTVCEGPILQSLALPQVEKISLAPSEDSYEHCPDDALPTLLSTVQRSQCSIAVLELADVIFIDILFDILECTSHVKTLKICTQDWESDYSNPLLNVWLSIPSRFFFLSSVILTSLSLIFAWKSPVASLIMLSLTWYL
ncbi:hypothetical protein DFS33DRAFT_1447705 [Desarmillaria ectypa]|nr:hypothetical protein DFS33DRAFT_1447705 [Desarmillaria ectypa]